MDVGPKGEVRVREQTKESDISKRNLIHVLNLHREVWARREELLNILESFYFRKWCESLNFPTPTHWGGKSSSVYPSSRKSEMGERKLGNKQKELSPLKSIGAKKKKSIKKWAIKPSSIPPIVNP